MASRKPAFDQNTAVRNYLTALADTKKKRGRRRTDESIRSRLVAIEGEMTSANPLRELLLMQERRDLNKELEARAQVVDIAVHEAEFIKYAKPYSERMNISKDTWREAGVGADVLQRAGL